MKPHEVRARAINITILVSVVAIVLMCMIRTKEVKRLQAEGKMEVYVSK